MIPRQLSLCLISVSTINKSQGQTLKHVSVNFAEPVFSHRRCNFTMKPKNGVKIIVPDAVEALEQY